MIKRIAALLLSALLLPQVGFAAEGTSESKNVIALKNGGRAVVSWQNPECDMSFARLYSVKNGEKTIAAAAFELGAEKVSEIEFDYDADADNYLLNLRRGDGTDEYYEIEGFKSISEDMDFIGDWSVHYNELSGVSVGLDREDKITGKSSLVINSLTNKENALTVSQSADLKIDKSAQYKLSFWIKASDNNSVNINLGYNRSSEKISFKPEIGEKAGDWKKVDFTFSGEYAGYVEIATGSGCAKSVKLDNMTLYMQKNGENTGTNLLKNSAFSVSDNIVNQEVQNVKAEEKGNKIKFSWDLPSYFDLEKVLIYKGDEIIGKVSAILGKAEINFRESYDGECTLRLSDSKGNLSEGVKITPKKEDKTTYVYRQYFDNAEAYNDFSSLVYIKKYSVSDGEMFMPAGTGIHLLPESAALSEFAFEADVKPVTSSSRGVFGIIFGAVWNEGSLEYSKISFDRKGNITAARYISDGKSAGKAVSGTEENATAEVIGTDSMSRLKLVQSGGKLILYINGEQVFEGTSGDICGRFGFETNATMGLYIDNIEIKKPDAAALAIYNDDYKRTGRTGFKNILRPNAALTVGNGCLSYADFGGNSLWVLEDDISISDFVFDFDYTFKKYRYGVGNYCGVAFGYNNDTSEYFRIGLRNEGKIFLAKLSANPDSNIKTYKEVSGSFETGKTYHMRLAVKNGNLKLYRDGELMLEYSGLGDTCGNIGLISNSAAAEFRNVIITPYYDFETDKQEYGYTEELGGMSVFPERIVKIGGAAAVGGAESGICITSEKAYYEIANSAEASDFVYESDFKFNSENEAAEFALLCRKKQGSGFYKISLKKSGELTAARYTDKMDFAEAYGGVKDFGISFGKNIDTSGDINLKLVAKDDILYVFVNGALQMSTKIYNQYGGFGFSLENAEVILEKMSVRNTAEEDFEFENGLVTSIENVEVTGNKAEFKINAGKDLENAAVVAAVYENGRLSETQVLDRAAIKKAAVKDYSISFSEEIGEKTIKIMIFSSLAGLKPAAKAASR